MAMTPEEKQMRRMAMSMGRTAGREAVREFAKLAKQHAFGESHESPAAPKNEAAPENGEFRRISLIVAGDEVERVKQLAVSNNFTYASVWRWIINAGLYALQKKVGPERRRKTKTRFHLCNNSKRKHHDRYDIFQAWPQ